jgi:ribonuclease P protein component
VHTRSFVLLVAPSAHPYPRLGITVSKQVGKAVRRNRVKRLVREVFRAHRGLLPPGSDIVVIARAGCRVDSMHDVAAELAQASAALAQACRRLRGGAQPESHGGRP